MSIWPSPMPPHLVEAFKHLGLKEIPGKKNNPIIVGWLNRFKAAWREDDTPWCGTFVHHCMDIAGVKGPQHWYRALAWAEFGYAVDRSDIPFGAIGGKTRKGGGHVFFIVARSPDGSVLYGLGGNQGNMVSIVPFVASEIKFIRWPHEGDLGKLPLPKVSAAQIGAVKAGSEA